MAPALPQRQPPNAAAHSFRRWVGGRLRRARVAALAKDRWGCSGRWRPSRSRLALAGRLRPVRAGCRPSASRSCSSSARLVRGGRADRARVPLVHGGGQPRAERRRACGIPRRGRAALRARVPHRGGLRGLPVDPGRGGGGGRARSRARLARSRRAPWVALAVWAVGLLAFFTVSPFKLPHYGLPAYPALALLAARGWRDGAPRRAADRGASRRSSRSRRRAPRGPRRAMGGSSPTAVFGVSDVYSRKEAALGQASPYPAVVLAAAAGGSGGGGAARGAASSPPRRRAAPRAWARATWPR